MNNINGQSVRIVGTQFRATGFVSGGGAAGLERAGLAAVRNGDGRSGAIRPWVAERVFEPANQGRVCVDRLNVFMRSFRSADVVLVASSIHLQRYAHQLIVPACREVSA
jgi:hypothetical protein